jgi:hypothetical protein
VGRSVGRVRRKRLFVGCFLRLAVRRFEWESSRALYWELSRWISSLTDWLRRSRRSSAFVTYQGASVIVRKVFYWNLSRISILEVEVVPQSCSYDYSFFHPKGDGNTIHTILLFRQPWIRLRINLRKHSFFKAGLLSTGGKTTRNTLKTYKTTFPSSDFNLWLQMQTDIVAQSQTKTRPLCNNDKLN